jgi:hypothetical protein
MHVQQTRYFAETAADTEGDAPPLRDHRVRGMDIILYHTQRFLATARLIGNVDRIDMKDRMSHVAIDTLKDHMSIYLAASLAILWIIS